MTFMS